MAAEITDARTPALVGTGSLAEGAAFGGYEILARLGAGGMGEVYRAHDATLDRDVAVKVVAGPAGEHLLLDEARAMAKLAHPNVVAVYDVGEVGGRGYVAMELVEGQTLRAWMTQDARGWDDVVRTFVLAGRGLAAAHDAGVVHRDFKPENVLIGDDGRVRVGDFGLAGAGARAGTPAYMSPEQRRGEAIDARSDQFSFCVALHEALRGARPGREPRALRRVPAWVEAVVRRGLAEERDARFPTMAALLQALDRDPAARRRRWLVAGALMATSALAAVGVVRALGPPPVVCDGGQARLAEVWSPARRAAIRAAFLASGRGYAQVSYEASVAPLDRYLAAWSAMHRESCQATAVRHDQSAEVLDLRMACLERRLGAFSAVAALFDRSWEPALVDQAPALARSLPDLDGCADTEALHAVVPPPADAVGERARQLGERLDGLTVLSRLGRLEAGKVEALAVVDEARAIGYPPLLARALYLGSRFRDLGGDPAAGEAMLREAIRAAAAGRDDAMTAELWGSLVFSIGAQARHDEARALIPAAETALARSGVPRVIKGTTLSNIAGAIEPTNSREALALSERAVAMFDERNDDERDDIASTLGTLAVSQFSLGRNDEGVRTVRRALAINEKIFGPDNIRIAKDLNNLGNLLKEQGHIDGAIETFLHGLDICLRALGPGSSRCAMLRHNLGASYRLQGKLELAEASLREALAVKERVQGASHPATVTSLIELAEVSIDVGRYEDAAAFTQRALATAEKALGPDNETVAQILEVAVRNSVKRGRPGEARAAAARSVAIFEKTLGPVHALLAQAIATQAAIALLEGRGEEALAGHRRALAMREQALGRDHDSVSGSLVDLGEALLVLRRPLEAVAPLERAVVILEKSAIDPQDLAGARFALARALGSGQRARALARAAREGFVADAARSSKQVAAVDRWLAR